MSEISLYQLRIRGFAAEHFRVRTFSGREALSEPYSFDVDVTCPAIEEAPVERSVLGRPAALVLRGAAVPHAFHGFVARAALRRDVRPHPGEVDGALHLRIRIVPRLWALRRRQGSRIFQGMSVPQVVDAVLRQQGISTEWRLRHSHPARAYCTQYEESDARFVERLLAEAGIFYFFVQPAEPAGDTDLIGQSTMVLGDDPAMYTGLDDGSGSPAPGLAYLDGEGTATFHGDKITRFEPAVRVAETSTTYREYDPERPHALLTTVASRGAIPTSRW